MTKTHEFKGEILADGRKRVTVTRLDAPLNAYNPAIYTTVRNIDGSNRFMRDGGGWTFLPTECEAPVGVAIAAAGGEPYPWPWMVQDWAKVAA